jgi:hypothetical protein
MRQRVFTDGRNIDGSLQRALGDREGEAASETEKFSSCQLSRCPPFSTINVSFIISCAPPPIVNLGMIFLLKGEDYNTPCYGKLNQVD